MHCRVRLGCDRDHAPNKKRRGKPLGKPRVTLGAVLIPYPTLNWSTIPCK